MSTENPKFQNSNSIRHPLSNTSIASLSIRYYGKNFVLHIIPFLIIVAINFILTNYVIKTDRNSIVSLNSITSTESIINVFIPSLVNMVVPIVIRNALLTIPMAISVLVVKNNFMQEGKSYGHLSLEVVPLIPKLLIIGGLVTVLTFSGYLIFYIGILVTSIIVPVWFCLTTVLIVQKEDKSFFGSLGKSKDLVSGNLSAVLGTLILIGTIQFICTFVVSLVVTSFLDPNAILIPITVTNPTVTLISNLISALLLPLSAIEIFFISVDMKWRQADMVRWGYYQSYPSFKDQPGQYGQYPLYGQEQPHVESQKKFCDSCGEPVLTTKAKFCARCGKMF